MLRDADAAYDSVDNGYESDESLYALTDDDDFFNFFKNLKLLKNASLATNVS